MTPAQYDAIYDQLIAQVATTRAAYLAAQTTADQFQPEVGKSQANATAVAAKAAADVAAANKAASDTAAKYRQLTIDAQTAADAWVAARNNLTGWLSAPTDPGAGGAEIVQPPILPAGS